MGEPIKIGLIDVDGHAQKKKWGATVYPNLAMAKIARYWKEKGTSVEWANPFTHYHKIYMSKVFNFTADDLTIYDADEIIKGGTGYDITSTLPSTSIACSLITASIPTYQKTPPMGS